MCLALVSIQLKLIKRCMKRNRNKKVYVEMTILYYMAQSCIYFLPFLKYF